jgi:hypothetical protein
MNRKALIRGQRGRAYAGIGGVLAVLGAILLLTSVFGAWSGGSNTPEVKAQETDGPDLDIEKNSGEHAGDPGQQLREYRIRASIQSGTLAPGDVVTITDDVDDLLVIVDIHDVNSDWTCPLPAPGTGNLIVCTLNNNAGLGSQLEDIFLLDVCDTVMRGSVDNDAFINLNGTPVAEDTTNPNVFLCAALTPTATPTDTPATPTATATATPPTAVAPDIKPPVTGTGGGASDGGSSTTWIGLASLLVGLGLLGWARRLSTQR